MIRHIEKPFKRKIKTVEMRNCCLFNLQNGITEKNLAILSEFVSFNKIIVILRINIYFWMYLQKPFIITVDP